MAQQAQDAAVERDAQKAVVLVRAYPRAALRHAALSAARHGTHARGEPLYAPSFHTSLLAHTSALHRPRPRAGAARTLVFTHVRPARPSLLLARARRSSTRSPSRRRCC